MSNLQIMGISEGEKTTCLLKYYESCAEKIENLEIRNDDVIITSFPNSGAKWMAEMVWLIKNRCDLRDVDVNIYQRIPMLEACATATFHTAKEPWLGNSIEYISRLKSQRFIKTHLPLCLMPKDVRNGTKSPKIIYVIRNPKDVFVSMYHHSRSLHTVGSSLEDYAKLFLDDKVPYAPYWQHVLSVYNIRHLSNVLIIKYEDMMSDLKPIIRKVWEFVEENPLTNEDLGFIHHRLDVKYMNTKAVVNEKFFVGDGGRHDQILERCDMVGIFNEEMTEEVKLKFDEWIKRNLINTDFEEPYAYGY
ncbi:hypothetical protein RI129_009951 [Pyrocoelia pectoralis]|uniref:Sulfotransferase domain-containing protein n=1 Tax=Pyrocoelia pectoralis TaxID=417401 RepID=A0AAN7VDI9_9COLE